MKHGAKVRICRSKFLGFTLLEVMIALVILSIGLLGIAALQGVGLKSTHGAYLTSQASLLAYDMADRIRANPGADYSGFSLDFETENCPPQSGLSLVDADRAQWGCSVIGLLPQATASITTVAATIPLATRYRITIEWSDRQIEEGDDPWNYVLEFEL